MEPIVTLVAKSRGQVIRAIALDMVMFDMVIKVRIPGVAHKRIKNVREKRIEPRKLFCKNSAHMDMLMHHQSISTNIVHLHQPVQDAMRPSKMIVQIDRTWDRGQKVQN